jgi:hypothetical protein
MREIFLYFEENDLLLNDQTNSYKNYQINI